MRVPPASQGFPEVGGKDLQGLAVLGDGAAGHHDALLGQYLRDLAVGERLAAVLGGHQLLDQRAYRGARSGTAGLGGDVAAEEILELVDTARGVHELLRRHARYRGLVQVERAGDLAQDQRAHRQLAVLEEVALAVDDGLGHAQYRIETLLHVLDQPFRLLQLAVELLGAGVAVALQDLGVEPVDAQPRHRIRVERCDPDALHLLDDDVRYDIARLLGGVIATGLGVESRDQLLHRAQHRIVAAQELPQAGEVARRERFQVIPDGIQRLAEMRRVLGQRCELQCQALPQVAGTHARRLEVLQVLERDLQLLQLDPQLRRKDSYQLVEALREIAVVVQRVDEEPDQACIALGQLRERELRQQVRPQRRRIRGYLLVLALLAVVAIGRGRRVVQRADVAIAAFGRRGVAGRLFGGSRFGGGGCRLRYAKGRVRGGGLLAGAVLALEQGIFLQHALQLLVELQRRQLQQADRLLQLRGEREVLGQPELK